jgi:unsaturated chondroitin disaccharide hydrolase
MKMYWLVAICCIVLSACTANKKSLDTQQALGYCVEKALVTAESLDDASQMPRNIDPGKTDWNTVGVRDWTSGFWPGILWYAYEASGNEELKKQAEKFTQPVEKIANSKAKDHDIGFQVFCSFGNAYRLTGNEEYKKTILAAADTLATLFNPMMGTILSWPKNKQYMHNTIMDNMMNLELLFWASKNGGGQNLYDIAVKHAETCMTTLIRPDFSSYHVAIFDTIDGHFVKGITHQGYADDSQWARGQAWGIYGYAMCYRETGKIEFLETAQKLADVFNSRLPEDVIPYWDFDDPTIPDAPKDASAAAVAACGMLEISSLLKDEAAKAKYKNAAVLLVENLSSDKYISGDTNKAMLLHSTGHHPKGTEIDVPIIYADYYYMEALLRLKKMEK